MSESIAFPARVQIIKGSKLRLYVKAKDWNKAGLKKFGVGTGEWATQVEREHDGSTIHQTYEFIPSELLSAAPKKHRKGRLDFELYHGSYRFTNILAGNVIEKTTTVDANATLTWFERYGAVVPKIRATFAGLNVSIIEGPRKVREQPGEGLFPKSAGEEAGE